MTLDFLYLLIRLPEMFFPRDLDDFSPTSSGLCSGSKVSPSKAFLSHQIKNCYLHPQSLLSLFSVLFPPSALGILPPRTFTDLSLSQAAFLTGQIRS